MKNIEIKIENALKFINPDELHNLQTIIDQKQNELIQKSGLGNDFLGWVDLPSNISLKEIDEIQDHAQSMAKKAEVIVVIGIGGSYLGAKAIITALNDTFCIEKGITPEIIFAGHQLSEDYHAELIEVLDKKEYAICVISKSGTTTEPAIAFRILKNHIEKKYGKEEAQKRITAITDHSKGALRQLATREDYKTFVIPDDVGGRYSLFTPVGLWPIAAAGFDIKKLIQGAAELENNNKKNFKIYDNPVSTYAATRYLLYKKGYSIEILVNYHPKLAFLSEWWKQLYGESEGKQGKGIFPASASFTTDLHSLGQYIQDGTRFLFETVISIENSKYELSIPHDKENLDGLNFLSGKRLEEVNKKAELATTMAHVSGGVPNIQIVIEKLDEYNIGKLIYFFEMACGLSGYLLEINPFDQPGVEEYKTNMFRLLGKPGF